MKIEMSNLKGRAVHFIKLQYGIISVNIKLQNDCYQMLIMHILMSLCEWATQFRTPCKFHLQSCSESLFHKHIIISFNKTVVRHIEALQYKVFTPCQNIDLVKLEEIDKNITIIIVQNV